MSRLGSPVVREGEALGRSSGRPRRRACAANASEPFRLPSRCRPRSRARGAATRGARRTRGRARANPGSPRRRRSRRSHTIFGREGAIYRGLDAHLRSGPQMLQYHALAADLAAPKAWPRPRLGLRLRAGLRGASPRTGSTSLRSTIERISPEPAVEPLERFPEISRRTSARIPSRSPSTPARSTSRFRAECSSMSSTLTPASMRSGGCSGPAGPFTSRTSRTASRTPRRSRGSSAATTTGSSRMTVFTPSGASRGWLTSRLHGAGVPHVHMLPLTLGGPARPSGRRAGTRAGAGIEHLCDESRGRRASAA